MLDHLGLDVTDYEVSKAFYQRALAPLGIELLMEPIPVLAVSARIRSRTSGSGSGGGPQTGVHVAFETSSRELVDAFHAAALEAGATDNGGPGKREIYHPNYYGAFVLDPDGNNVEAVCHLPA